MAYRAILFMRRKAASAGGRATDSGHPLRTRASVLLPGRVIVMHSENGCQQSSNLAREGDVLECWQVVEAEVGWGMTEARMYRGWRSGNNKGGNKEKNGTDVRSAEGRKGERSRTNVDE